MIYGPFADLGPPQALVLKHDILANERRMMWRSGRALQAKPARAIRSRVGTTPADDVVAGIVSHIIPCMKSVRDFMWALTVALMSLATLLFEVSYCERITTL